MPRNLDATERFELLADLYHRATGNMAPGKDRPAAMGDTTSSEQRFAEFRAWCQTEALNAALRRIARLTKELATTRAQLELVRKGKGA